MSAPSTALAASTHAAVKSGNQVTLAVHFILELRIDIGHLIDGVGFTIFPQLLQRIECSDESSCVSQALPMTFL